MSRELAINNKIGVIDENRYFLVDLDIAYRFSAAKWALVGSSLKGLVMPHYLESYYIISKHL